VGRSRTFAYASLESHKGVLASRRQLLAYAGALAAALLFQGCSGKTQGAANRPAAPVLVATSQIRVLPIEVQAIGNVEPVVAIAVRSQVSGELSQILFEEGEFVRKGQTLFVIDQQPFQSQVRQAQANLAKDLAQLRQAKANLARDSAQDEFAQGQAKRASELLQQGVLSKEQFEQTQSDASVRTQTVQADQAAIDSAQAAIDADQEALNRAELEIGYCTIKSPIDGRTGAVTVKPGNLVTANGTQFTTINQVQPTYVTFSVPEKYLPDVRKFMAAGKLSVSASLRDAPSSKEKGSLSFVDNAVDAATGTIKLKGLFPNDGRTLWPGQFVSVTLELSSQPNALVVPAQAVQAGQDRQFVFVVKPDMTAEMRTVTVGMRVDQEVVIESGLQPGEKVVTEGQLRLIEGSRVSIQDQTQSAPQAR
jgi:multidrug efflux system membrane fusion protein